MAEEQLSRADRFNLGLTGYPVGHSLSPVIHSAALRACELEGNYSLFPVHPGDRRGLMELLERVRAGEIHGLNVTIPHKQNVITYLDALTPAAQSIGAVNTIFVKDGQLTGENTDAPGFMADLTNFAKEVFDKHQQRNALVLGAGGSARAVTYALSHAAWEVAISARRSDQAQELVHALNSKNITAVESNDLLHQDFDLLVNATPVGMTPNPEASPWELPLPSCAMVYDLVYNPRETRLIREARAAGLPATTSLGMLIEQAILSFEIWTGRCPPRDILQRAVAAIKQTME